MALRPGFTRLALLALALAVAACASSAGPARLAGSVTCRERIALPPGAVVHVALLDVSLVGTPARVIAQQAIRPTGQVPIPFVVEYERGEIDPARRYGLRATISDADGRVLFANVTTQPVFREGAPEEVTIVVQRARPSAEP